MSGIVLEFLLEHLLGHDHIKVGYHDILICASMEGDVQMVTKILALSPELLPKIADTPLREACTRNHVEVVALLMKDPRVDPSVDVGYIFLRVCAKGHAEVAALLMKDPRVHPAANQNHALYLACVNGHAEVAALLLKDPRVDLTAVDNCIVNNTAQNEHLEIVKLLEEHRTKKQKAKREKEKEDERKKEEATSPEKEPIAIVVIRKAMAKNSTKVIINILQKHWQELTPILDEIVDWALEKEEMEILELLLQ